MSSRTERDSFGPIDVPDAQLWGAQTQRSLEHFHISTERMPPELIHALARVKRGAAKVNLDLGLLDGPKALAITRAADEVLANQHSGEFPLAVWQTGSGTQSNMNMNEVLANRGSELMGGVRGEKRLLHPNDDVNLGQSSNDIFPTAIHVAAAQALANTVLPALRQLRATLHAKSEAFAAIVKIGRTHLQDATPLTLGQEFSGYVAQLDFAEHIITAALPGVLQLAAGGTAVGTGLNAHPEYAVRIAAELEHQLGLPFRTADNKFAALAGHDALVAAHGSLKTLATALMKIANDVRWMASGPRSGLGEIRIPENEPGSSIMPGKVNSTQCEAMTMVCCQVFGNHTAITIARSQGHFELNVYKPVLAYCMMHSIQLLADVSRSFTENCVEGIRADEKRIRELMERSLLLVTALAPKIGYDNDAKVAKTAHSRGTTLKEEAVRLGFVSATEFDRLVQPDKMTHPG